MGRSLSIDQGIKHKTCRFDEAFRRDNWALNYQVTICSQLMSYKVVTGLLKEVACSYLFLFSTAGEKPDNVQIC